MSNNHFCVYFDNKNIVNDIMNFNWSIIVNNHIIPIRKLENQSIRIIISNVPPIIPHITITKALNIININTLSPITFLKAGFTVEDLSYIISFRKQTHIPHKDISKLLGTFVTKFEGTDYWVLFTHDTLTCYLCEKTGHSSAQCKNTSVKKFKSSRRTKLLWNLIS